MKSQSSMVMKCPFTERKVPLKRHFPLRKAAFVKENYILSQERITVFTQASLVISQILFHCSNSCLKERVRESNWFTQKELKVIGHQRDHIGLTQCLTRSPIYRHNLFTESNYALYILDDYSVHVTGKVRTALFAIGYILIVIVGGITGDVQCNDTHVHHLLKKKYRELEAELMIGMLRKDPNKIRSSSRDNIMKMLSDAWNLLDIEAALKQNFLTSALSGSEDYRVREKLYSLVFEVMNDFRIWYW